MFDTEEFLNELDIDGEIIIRLKDMEDDKVRASFEIDDELVKVNFDGYLEKNSEITRETFLGD